MKKVVDQTFNLGKWKKFLTLSSAYFESLHSLKWDKVFKNGPRKICGRQPKKIFTWTILE